MVLNLNILTRNNRKMFLAWTLVTIPTLVFTLVAYLNVISSSSTDELRRNHYFYYIPTNLY